MQSLTQTTRGSSLRLFYSDKVRSLIQDTGLPLNRAPEALGLKSSEFLDWWSGYKPKIIQYKHLDSLGHFLRTDTDQIMGGTYDKEFIRSLLFNGHEALPERYSQNQFSYIRSSAHIIKFLTITRGQHFSDKIIRKMNMSPLIYADLNNQISLNYFIDLLEVLAANGMTQSELDSLACVLFLGLGDTPLGEKFKKAKTYYECYEILAENISLFDSNFNYAFELDRGFFQLKAILYYDNHSHINWSRTKIDRLLRYRNILLAWFPFLSKLSPVFPQQELFEYSDRIEAVYTISFIDENSRKLFCVKNNF